MNNPMDKQSHYRIWAPEESVWSPWVKPALFAHLPRAEVEEAPAVPTDESLDWLIARGAAAVVFDLRGSESVALGLLLARRTGFHPVPLFSSVPPDSPEMLAAVRTEPLLTALQRGSAELEQLRFSPATGPAFLLDADRWAPGAPVPPINAFDNRSAVFASDFPSAGFLRDRGIHRCVVVRDPAIAPGDDLGFALLPWRKAGMTIEVVTAAGAAIGFSWPAAGFWGCLSHRARLALSLHPNARGGYGRFVPESSGG